MHGVCFFVSFKECFCVRSSFNTELSRSMLSKEEDKKWMDAGSQLRSDVSYLERLFEIRFSSQFMRYACFREAHANCANSFKQSYFHLPQCEYAT
jgi:hypothetical protein